MYRAAQFIFCVSSLYSVVSLSHDPFFAKIVEFF